MHQKTCAIVVGSEHIEANSPPMATIGETRFLDFLLSRIGRAHPDKRKIFTMAYRNIIELDKALFDRVQSHGFEMFVADRDYSARLARVARHFRLDCLIDIDVRHPLTSLHFIDDMLERHIRDGNDATISHNLPRSLAPVIVNAEAITSCKSFTVFGLARHWGVEEAFKPMEHYASFMLSHPGLYKTGLYEAPIRWEGAGYDFFSEDLAGLTLHDAAALGNLREVIHTIGSDEFTCDQVIDAVLIGIMRKGWGTGAEFDTNYTVVDSATMGDEESFKRRSASETDWFVCKDEHFLDGRDPGELSILEVGCGHGRLCRHLAERFREVHGTDGSRERAMEARFRLKEFGNVHITQNDGRSLVQYPDAFADRVFAHGVLVHIGSKSIIDTYILEMARVTKPGGLLKFDIYHGTEVFGIGHRHFLGARYTEQEIGELFAKAGVELVNIDYEMNVEYYRPGSGGRQSSGLPLKQMLVVGKKR